MWGVRESLSQREEEKIPWVLHCLGDDICSRVPALGGYGELTHLTAAKVNLSHIHVLPSLPPALDLVLGAEGSEESEPGPGGPAPGRHRVCWEGGPVSPHPELQEKPQLQHFGQVV